MITLLLLLLLAASAAALIPVSTTETLLSATHRHAQETGAAADAALERALHDLSGLPDWTSVLAEPPGNLTSFSDGRATVIAPDGRTLDLARLTAERQRDSDRDYGPHTFGADSPRWRLYAHAPLAGILPSGSAVPPAYLVVWVADDGGDGDGNPSIDANSRILVHAEAYGSGGARRGVEASVSRLGQTAMAIQLLAWREVSY